MKLTKIKLAGMQYLAAVTELLQDIRLESSSSGLYEAADLQWWWRKDEAAYPERQIFWHDEKGGSVACLLRFDAGSEWNQDLFFLPSAERVVREEVVPEIISTISSANKPSTITVRDDDFTFQRLIEEVGFAAGPTAIVQTQLSGVPPKAELKQGFRLHSREQDDSRPHYMIQRGGPEIARKLKECSLYRPDLDLAIRDTTGAIVAYGLFWMDPVTKIGLIEPMRTEAPFQRLGLAKYLIAEGISRLRSLGADVIKVSYKTNNKAAAQLYHRCGFQDQFKKLEYQKSSNHLSSPVSSA